jgi:SAM-dependent methyltransferase
MAQSKDYLLGVNHKELERLRFQHGVWKPVTDGFLDRIGVKPGWKCLDVGGGPGFVALDLCDRVGPSGEVTVLEPSAFYLAWFQEEAARRGWKNARVIEGTSETAALPDASYDLIFSRWVIGFVPSPEKFLAPLFRALRPGGVIALEDYVYEGLSLYPRGGAFDGMADAVRAYWRSGGGDPYVGAKVPAIFRENAIRLSDYAPHCLAGGNTSGVFEWAHRFFTVHIDQMVERNVLTPESGSAMLADWLAHKENPDMVFVSPIVMDIAGVRTA